VPVLSKTQAELYLFDTDTDIFVIQEKEVEVDIALNGEFECRSESVRVAQVRLDRRSPTVDAFHVNAHRRGNESSV